MTSMVKLSRAQSHKKLTSQLKKKRKSAGNISLTEHIASFWGSVARIICACKHIDHILSTEREQVLLILDLIKRTDSLLQVHVSGINSNPSGCGVSFEDTTTHLMLAYLVKNNQLKQSNRKASVSSSLAGRGTSTSVTLRWYPNWEYKKLDDKEKKELGDWRKTPAWELAMKKLREDVAKKRKQARSGVAGNNSNDGNNNSGKR